MQCHRVGFLCGSRVREWPTADHDAKRRLFENRVFELPAWRSNSLSVISRRNFSATHARALRESRFRHHEAKVTSDR
jgi:hypothetical protein